MDNSQENKSVFSTLSRVAVKEHTEKIGQLTYLSWSWAWGYVKEHYPDAVYTIYENANGWPYHTDGRTAWVKTGLTINGIEHIEYLPIMDNRHLSIPLERITSRNVNDSIQRSLTKAAARHGLGLNVYAGEDLLMFSDGAIAADSTAMKADVAKSPAAAAKPAKTAQNKAKRIVTKETLDSGKDLDIIAWLKEAQPGTAAWNCKTDAMLKGYQFDSIETYNEIIARAQA